MAGADETILFAVVKILADRGLKKTLKRLRKETQIDSLRVENIPIGLQNVNLDEFFEVLAKDPKQKKRNRAKNADNTQNTSPLKIGSSPKFENLTPTSQDSCDSSLAKNDSGTPFKRIKDEFWLQKIDKEELKRNDFRRDDLYSLKAAKELSAVSSIAAFLLLGQRKGFSASKSQKEESFMERECLLHTVIAIDTNICTNEMGSKLVPLDAEEIEWPNILEPLVYVSGSSPFGWSWKVLYARQQYMQSLIDKLQNLERDIRHYERRQYRLSEKIKLAEENGVDGWEYEAEIAQLDVLINEAKQQIINVENELKEMRQRYDNEPLNDQEQKQVIRIKSNLDEYMALPRIEGQHGALRIKDAIKLVRNRSPFAKTWSIMVVSMAMNKGSVGNFLCCIPNTLPNYKMQDAVILSNLKEHIKLMSFLESKGIGHFAIKPNNLVISPDGTKLLLVDFCPESIFKERCFKIAKNHIDMPEFKCPVFECILSKDALIASVDAQQIIKTEVPHFNDLSLENVIDVFKHKHDVFCMGLVYYCIMALKPVFVIHLYKCQTPAPTFDGIIEEISEIKPHYDKGKKLQI
ncbi:Protein kinase-like domain superfamily [Babesia duncani]|uniref:Protein kinase-like domain superfamily n=1 Tax=Babesia duncani TaxID=323732 RepID=A0AAD9UNM1_9APIC|nr:Protein kinase-like domain superfamily [Babesia duncani]